MFKFTIQVKGHRRTCSFVMTGPDFFVPRPAKGHIDKRMAADAEKVARGETVEGRYLTYFLSQTNLPMKSIYSNVTELLLAGVDTVRSRPPRGLYVPAEVSVGLTCVNKGRVKRSPLSCPRLVGVFRFPAPCPGRCTSCLVTQRSRLRSGRRC